MIFIVFIWFIFHIRQGSPSYNCHSISEVTLNGLDRTGMYQPQHTRTLHISLGYNMMTSSNGNIFRVTGHLCGEFTGPGEFPAQRPVTRSFVFSLICTRINGWVNNGEAGDLRRRRAHYDIILMICMCSVPGPRPHELTHWGRVTHICVGNLTIIGSDNGLSPGRRQAIIWTNAGILLIGPLETNFSEIWIAIEIFSLRKMHLKMSSGKWRPFCLGLNVLTV